MQGGPFTYALLAALATALLVASFTDLKRRQIDNWLNLAVALGAPLFWLSTGLDWTGVAFQIGLAAATFAVACLLFALRQMGGGDVKLLTALALWFVPDAFLLLVIMMAVVGGGASIAAAAFNMRRVPGEGLRDGIAMVAATAWVAFAASATFALGTGRPIITGSAVDAVRHVLPAVWLLWTVGALVAAIFFFGMRHMMRRQKTRLPIPYGVAISIAALWVMADRYIYVVPVTPGLG